MKGTEKIIAHIRADAEAQSAEILARAEEQCAAIRADFEEKARERYNERLLAGEKACEDRVDSMDRIARMEARKGLLALKQEMVSQSFDKALTEIVALPREKYIAFLAKLAAQAAVTGTEEIVLNERDRKAIGADLVKAANALLKGGKLTLSDKTGDFAGGLILRRGSIEANCTLELLVELSRNELSAQVAELLFA